MNTSQARLLEPGDQELAGQFKLSVRRRSAGLVTGEQRSPALGGGIEFAEYREYQPGDDVRQLDWAVYLRLNKLMVKLAAEEKELTLMVILDTSRSMAFGEPDKFRLARRIAVILCGIARANGNRAGVLGWGEDLRELIPPQGSNRPLSWFASRLEGVETTDVSDMQRSLKQFATRYNRRCLAVLVSDLLFDNWPQVLAGLAASNNESCLIHILSPEELDPQPGGELTLLDSETAKELAVDGDQGGIQRYHAILDEFISSVGAGCRARGLGHVHLSSDRALAAIFHQDLRRGGLLC